MNTFYMILGTAFVETVISGIIIAGSVNLYWLLTLPFEFLLIVIVGVWMLGWR